MVSVAILMVSADKKQDLTSNFMNTTALVTSFIFCSWYELLL